MLPGERIFSQSCVCSMSLIGPPLEVTSQHAPLSPRGPSSSPVTGLVFTPTHSALSLVFRDDAHAEILDHIKIPFPFKDWSLAGNWHFFLELRQPYFSSRSPLLLIQEPSMLPEEVPRTLSGWAVPPSSSLQVTFRLFPESSGNTINITAFFLLQSALRALQSALNSILLSESSGPWPIQDSRFP